MDLRRLEQFVAVAQEGGFGRAARRLNISQPALTRSIGVLEGELGALLFERGPRGAALTTAGEKLLPHALLILNEANRAIAELDTSHAVAEGQVRIGVSPNFLTHVMPHVIHEIGLRAPQLNIQVITGTREALGAKLIARELDVALCIVPEFVHATRAETNELTFEEIGIEHVEPYVAPDHPLLNSAVTLEQLATERWAVPFELSVPYRFVSLFFRNGMRTPQQALNSASLPLLRQAAAGSGMVALLPRREAEADVRAGRLVLLPTPDLVMPYTVGLLVRRATTVPPPALRLVMDTLRAVTRAELGS